MIYPVPFEADHYGAMAVHGAQAWLSKYATVSALRPLEGEFAGTLMRDGKPVMCGGAIPLWENRALLWAFFDAAIRPEDFRTVHGYAKTFVENLPFRRVEAGVVVEYEEGHRWMRLLGFECETPLPNKMRAYQVDGSDCLLYARIKDTV